MQARFESRPAFTVLGLKYRGPNQDQELPKLWERFMPRSSEIKHRIMAEESFGVTHNFDEPSGEFDYYAGFAVSDLDQIPEGMQSIDIPAQDYAVFDCTLPTLMDTIQAVYREWLPPSDYVRAPGPEFELYDERWKPEAGRQAMSFCVPVTKK